MPWPRASSATSAQAYPAWPWCVRKRHRLRADHGHAEREFKKWADEARGLDVVSSRNFFAFSRNHSVDYSPSKHSSFDSVPHPQRNTHGQSECRSRGTAPVRPGTQPLQQRPARLTLGVARQDAGAGSDWRDQEQRKFTEAFDATVKTLGGFLETSGEHVKFLAKKATLIEEYLKQH